MVKENRMYVKYRLNPNNIQKIFMFFGLTSAVYSFFDINWVMFFNFLSKGEFNSMLENTFQTFTFSLFWGCAFGYYIFRDEKVE